MKNIGRGRIANLYAFYLSETQIRDRAKSRLKTRVRCRVAWLVRGQTNSVRAGITDQLVNNIETD